MTSTIPVQPFKPEFFQVSSFQLLKLKHLHWEINIFVKWAIASHLLSIILYANKESCL